MNVIVLFPKHLVLVGHYLESAELVRPDLFVGLETSFTFSYHTNFSHLLFPHNRPDVHLL